MSQSGNRTPPLNGTPPLNRTPPLNAPVPSLNVVNLSRRLGTLKRKTASVSEEQEEKGETPVKRPAIAEGPSSEERRRMYARTKNQVVFWRKNPETGEAEMVKMAKQGGRKRATKRMKRHRRRTTRRRRS